MSHDRHHALPTHHSCTGPTDKIGVEVETPSSWQFRIPQSPNRQAGRAEGGEPLGLGAGWCRRVSRYGVSVPQQVRVPVVLPDGVAAAAPAQMVVPVLVHRDVAARGRLGVDRGSTGTAHWWRFAGNKSPSEVGWGKKAPTAEGVQEHWK